MLSITLTLGRFHLHLFFGETEEEVEEEPEPIPFIDSAPPSLSTDALPCMNVGWSFSEVEDEEEE